MLQTLLQKKDQSYTTHIQEKQTVTFPNYFWTVINRLVFRFKGSPLYFLFLYIPTIFYSATYLAWKAKSWSFFTLVNPGFKMGGWKVYSKFDINRQIPIQFRAKSKRFNQTPTISNVLNFMQKYELSYPIILKPDVGERGLGVAKIKDLKALQSYLTTLATQKIQQPLIVEEFLTETEEYAILWYRMPNQSRGKILSFTKKHFLKVIGDGENTIADLVEIAPFLKDKKCLAQKNLKAIWSTVLPKGKAISISELGNCHEGIVCENLNSFIHDGLEKQLDNIANNIDGFNFGRFDIKANSEYTLFNGDFKIIEINGVNSTPLHIYDKSVSYKSAFLYLLKHWRTICEITNAHQKKGLQPENFWAVFKVTFGVHFKNRWTYGRW